MNVTAALLAAVVVSLISLVSIILFSKKLSKLSSVVTYFIAFAAGTMLGNAFFHLMPEYLEQYHWSSSVAFYILVGMTIMLVVEAFFHCSHDSSHMVNCKDESHPHHGEHLGLMNLSGDFIHNFLDGIAIGASFLISTEVGIATTVAVILHEIPQEFADTMVLSYAGWKRGKIILANALTSLTAILGVLVVIAATQVMDTAEALLIPIAIGQFIYIALADLLPEIHNKARVKKYIGEISLFIIGMGIFYYISTFLHLTHAHG